MKMIRFTTLNIFLLLLFQSCSELKVNEENYPDSYSITTSNIVTEHPMVNLNLDRAEYDFMYANYFEKIFVTTYVDYYDEDGNKLLDSAKARIEIKGATSSRKALKSLGIIFDEEIDNANLKVVWPEKIIANHDLSEIKTFRLRNSGNDFNETLIKDMCYTQMALDADMNLEIMYPVKPVIFFVNHRYEGILNMRTESNAHGISHLFGKDSADIALLKVDNDNGNLEYDEGNAARSRELVDALRSDDEEAIRTLVDVDNLIEYAIFQDYVGNHDWPHNNTRAYSLNGAPFRFIVYDLDFASFNTKNPILPELEFKSDDVAKIFQAFMDTPGFRDKLDKRREVLYSRFSAENFNNIVDRFAGRINNDMFTHIGRYNLPPSHMEWKMHVEQLKREMNQRDKYIRRKYKLD